MSVDIQEMPGTKFVEIEMEGKLDEARAWLEES